MNNQKETCPICPRHCAEDALSCERGRSFFQGNAGSTQGYGRFQESGDGHGGGQRHSHGHFDHNVSKDSLSGILAQCGHCIFHGRHDGKDNEEELFAALSDLEKEELKKLLTKLLASWMEK